MNETSGGCILCVQCAGKHTMFTLFSRTRPSSCIPLGWENCPSSTTTTGSSSFGLTWPRNCCNYCMKLSVCIQPDLWHVAVVSRGAPSNNSVFMLTLGWTRNVAQNDWQPSYMWQLWRAKLFLGMVMLQSVACLPARPPYTRYAVPLIGPSRHSYRLCGEICMF
jgi:hypothetical protein